MISKDDKQKILNGTFAIPRDGRKCKFVGKTALAGLDDESLNFFIYFNSDELVASIHHLTDDLLFDINYKSDNDVVGLWDDSIKPFNLEKALGGEPVMLRDGSKAFVKYVMPEEFDVERPLNGFVIERGEVYSYRWSLDGTAIKPTLDHPQDIIGMWKEPPPKTVTVTLPCPLKEPKDDMWFISRGEVAKSNNGRLIPSDSFKRISYFGSAKDARAWVLAMQENRR